jgi:hypothetical protein
LQDVYKSKNVKAPKHVRNLNTNKRSYAANVNNGSVFSQGPIF